MQARIAAVKSEAEEFSHSPNIHRYAADDGSGNNSTRRLMNAVRSYLAASTSNSDVRLYDEAKFIRVKRRVAAERQRTLIARHAAMPKISKNSIGIFRGKLSARLDEVFDAHVIDTHLSLDGLKACLVDLKLFSDLPGRSLTMRTNEDELALELFNYLSQASGAVGSTKEAFSAFFLKAFDVVMTADPVHTSKLRISSQMLGLENKPLAKPLTSMLYNFNESLPTEAEPEDAFSQLLESFRQHCKNELAFAVVATLKVGHMDEQRANAATEDALRDCTFRPTINNTSRADGEAASVVDPLLYAQELYRKAQEAEAKKKVTRMVHLRREMAECTFKPAINSASKSSISAAARRHLQSKHDVVHAEQIEAYAARGAERKAAVEVAVDNARTLADLIAPLPGKKKPARRKRSSRKRPSTASSGRAGSYAAAHGGKKRRARRKRGRKTSRPATAEPKGYKEAVERLRKAKEVREEIMLREAPRGAMFSTQFADTLARKSAEAQLAANTSIEGFAPPASTNRPVPIQPKVRKVTAHLPDLLVEVKLGPDRIARIPLRRRDDPAKVARQFSLTHGLDRELRAKLVVVLKAEVAKLLRDNPAGSVPAPAPEFAAPSGAASGSAPDSPRAEPPVHAVPSSSTAGAGTEIPNFAASFGPEQSHGRRDGGPQIELDDLSEDSFEYALE